MQRAFLSLAATSLLALAAAPAAAQAPAAAPALSAEQSEGRKLVQLFHCGDMPERGLT